MDQARDIIWYDKSAVQQYKTNRWYTVTQPTTKNENSIL